MESKFADNNNISGVETEQRTNYPCNRMIGGSELQNGKCNLTLTCDVLQFRKLHLHYPGEEYGQRDLGVHVH